MNKRYDMIILGSGSTAFAAAIKAAELGKTAAMCESRTLGGTCVSRGCLPSKNLIEAARIVWEASHPRYRGLRACTIEIDFRQLVSQKDQVVEHFRRQKYHSIVDASDRIDVYYGQAHFVSPRAIAVDGQILEAEHFLIATGSRPYIPDVEGLEEVPYMTSDLLTAGEAAEMWELPASLIILGGGYIALELGQMFQRFGTKVTLLERGPRILKDHEPEVSTAITDLLRSDGVTIVTNGHVKRIQQKGQQIVVIVSQGGREQELSASSLLVATGRIPNTDSLALEKAGVRTDGAGFVPVNDYLQTNVPHIWAAGDVIGRHTGSQLATPVGAHDGSIAALNALSGTMRKVDHSVIPRAIFTDPQVATVGLTEARAMAKGHKCWCNTLSMDIVPRAGATRDTRGIVKMVADADSNQVLGVSLVMRDAAEVIHEAAMALRFGAKIDDFIDMIHVYPTMAEALKLVAISRYKDPAMLSCCAE